MNSIATTRLSSKGQVVIPEEIRTRLGLETGAEFVVLGDRDVIIFKLLEPPSLDDFEELVGQARRTARKSGLKQADVANAVRKARRGR